MRYTELHLHGHHSLLDGLNNPTEYMTRAKELGMSHLALTDHGTLAGHREFQRAAKEAGITPILGCEMYISATDRFDRRTKAKREDGTEVYNHIIVLSQNSKGLENLNKLSEVAWTEGFYSKPRIDMEVLKQHNEGLIVLSGCMSGLIAKSLQNDDAMSASMWTRDLKEVFDDRFFMELQGHNPPKLNHDMAKLAKRYGVKSVVTSDCHYAREEDLWLEEAMLILATKPNPRKDFDYSRAEKMSLLDRFNYAYPERFMTFQEFEIFLRSAQQQHELLAKQGIDDEPIHNTILVADMIEADYPYHENLDLLPRLNLKKPDAEVLEDMAWKGLEERGLKGIPEYDARLREELDIIKPRFPTYFIVEADFVQWALKQGIRVGPGRGSGAGSLVNYALRITNVDPIKRKLLFFRFINPERNDYPDVDTDFEIARRNEVKAYVTRKYKHVASIANFNTFQGKSAVRDASRVMMVPLGDVNRALKGADWPSSIDFFDMWDKTEQGQEFTKKYPDAVKLAKFCYGRLKTQGMHAGGIVISREPISKHAPIQSANDTQDEAGERIPLVALDMDEAAKVGYIKYDMLGLKALTIISDTLNMIKERHGIDIDLDNMEYDDPVVYDKLSMGLTKGVFQCEATPYTNLLVQMGGVKNFDELVASNALVRPGAMKSSAGARFIARKQGLEKVTYPHELMKPFTEETYGVVIYQEQVMLTMTELAGMTMSDADKVRKIIGKKRDVSEFEEYKEKFISGASKHVAPEIAEGLWHDFEAHAGYSFNKSHADAYSMISYWTAWLKEKYPLEFMCAILKNEDDKDSRLDYLIEAKRLGIRVMLPHVNASGENFEIQTVDGQDVIRFGLSNIKFISGKVAHNLMDQRPFLSYKHLQAIASKKYSGISTRIIGSLNKVGAAAFEDNPRTGNERENFYEYLAIPAFKTRDLSPRIAEQLRPLDLFSDTDTFVCMGMVREIKTGPGWARIDMVDETGTAGVFTDEHNSIETGQMYVFLISNNRIARYITVDDLVADNGGAFQEFLEKPRLEDVPEGQVKVVSFKSRTTRAGKKMADIVFADEDKDMISALVWPSDFPKAFTYCKEGAVLGVELKELDGGGFALSNIL